MLRPARAAWIAAMCVRGLVLGVNPAVASDFTHVRSDDASIRALLRSGYERSATFKGLVDEIESLPGIVYIEPAVKLSRGLDAALLHSVGGSQGIAVLRVLLKTNLARDYAVGVLAHELQHVAEVLRAGPPRNGTDVSARFAAHDPEPVDRTFETEDARAVMNIVLREWRANRGHRGTARRERSSNGNAERGPLASAARGERGAESGPINRRAENAA
jgi:hypothetical protein